MAVDLTTGSYDADGIFSKHNATQNENCETKNQINLSLNGFQTKRILKECARRKSIAVEGNFPGTESSSIVVIEKMPFDPSALQQLFTSDSRLELKFQNNIYANYHIFPPSDFNGIEIKVIRNPTEEDFSKFIDKPIVMIQETPEAYKAIVLPHFISQQSSAQEIKDTLCEKDKENVIFYDPDPVLGFKLIEEPSEREIKDEKYFRASAVCQNEVLRSLRDLASEHLPFLLNIQEKGLKEMSKKYNTSTCKIETYVQYPPSHYPFHVFFQSVEKDFSIPAEKAHQLTAIISNLQLIPHYYQKVDLRYSLPESDKLTVELLKAGALNV